jgi:hypothetical protein
MSSPVRRASPLASPLLARRAAPRRAVLALALLPWLALTGCRGHEATEPKPEVLAAEPTEVAKTEPGPAKADADASKSAKPEPAKTDETAKAEPAKVEPAQPEPGKLAPLGEEQLAIFWGTAQDSAPEWRGGITEELSNLHYLSGNEKTLDAFHATLSKDEGGAYMGVGTDQAYIFTGWARFELAWLTDYDPAVKEVHELYRMFILASPTPAEFVALWDKESREKVYAIIGAAESDEERAWQHRYWYRNSVQRIRNRFSYLNRRMAKAGVRTFLDDQEQYDYVRMMLEQRRMRPLVVDLHAEKGVAAIAEATKQLGVPIRVLYLSNAEQYWKRYPKQFKANVGSLQFAENGIVLRTLLSQSANVDYRYNVQPAANYQDWLSKPYTGNVYQIVRKGPKASPEGITFFETTDDPDDSAMGRRWNAKRGIVPEAPAEAPAKDAG